MVFVMHMKTLELQVVGVDKKSAWDYSGYRIIASQL
jgi:hypothetical protein